MGGEGHGWQIYAWSLVGKGEKLQELLAAYRSGGPVRLIASSATTSEHGRIPQSCRIKSWVDTSCWSAPVKNERHGDARQDTRAGEDVPWLALSRDEILAACREASAPSAAGGRCGPSANTSIIATVSVPMRCANTTASATSNRSRPEQSAHMAAINRRLLAESPSCGQARGRAAV